MAHEVLNEYEDAYDEESLWNKIARFALRAGREVIKKALLLYYALLDANTPAWAKSVIVGALGYFIFPVDAVPDVIPAVGFADDLGVLALALAQVAAHVNEEHAESAKKQLDRLFGPDSDDGEEGEFGSTGAVAPS